MRKSVAILGGGPAGASAAIAASRETDNVRLIEKSKFPRHKVCGEFFSPEIGPELERLGAWDDFLALGPARVRNMKLHFERRAKACRLPEAAWGLSRYAFDALMLKRARAAGVEMTGDVPNEGPMVLATGRSVTGSKRGRRIFGFKAHFDGPADDAVELFFFEGCYVGVNAVEGGRTNVCGLAPEEFLRRYDFDYDCVVRQSQALKSRLDPLTRAMEWISTGPLRYGQAFEAGGEKYRAGDALSFVDPFTGSGLLSAVKTGALAGIAAARGEPVARYLEHCRASLKKPFEIASIFRKAVDYGCADWLAAVVPGRVLFALTRPQK